MVDVEELVEESKPILPPALASGMLVEAKAQPPPLVTSHAPTVTEPSKLSIRGAGQTKSRSQSAMSDGPRSEVQHSRYNSLVGENLNIIEQMQTNESLCK